MSLHTKIIILLSSFFLVSCSLTPNYKEPDARFNANINMNECIKSGGTNCSPFGSASEVSFDEQWWKIFNDKDLNMLVDKALQNNTDLRIAFIRFEQAAQTLGIDRSNLLPKLDGQAGVTRSSSGRTSPTNMSGRRQTSNSFNMGLNLSYELDLWGKYRDGYLASSRAYEASIYDYQSSKLTLVSNVVKMYFNAINLNSQLKILEQTVSDYERTYELNNELYKMGAISEYELYSYKAQLDSARAQLETAKANKDNNDKALMILVSSNLDDILYSTSNKIDIEYFKVELPQGISSEILLQRPDIAAALKRLEQQNYLVGVARTAYLPDISLTGMLGFGSSQLNNLTQGSSFTWNAGANGTMPIFRWGEIRYNVNLAKLAKDEAYLNYENILKNALGEVRTALVNREMAFNNEKNYAELLKSQERIYQLAQVRYENGNSSLNDMLDARRNYLNAKLSYESSVYTLISSVVDIIKAFGGGFDKREDYEDSMSRDLQNLDMSFRN